MFTSKFPPHCFENTGAIGPGSKYISVTPLRPHMDIQTLLPKHHRPASMLLACLYATGLPLHPSLHLHHRPTSSVFIIVIIFIIVFSIVIVLIIVIVHPLSLQSSYISLFMGLDFSSIFKLFSFLPLLSMQLKHVIFMCF
jgi:hypothetical protein